MLNKLIMLLEFAICGILVSVGFSVHFPFIMQNVFFIFMGIIALIMASNRMDQVLGNGQYNTDKSKHKHPPVNEHNTTIDDEDEHNTVENE